MAVSRTMQSLVALIFIATFHPYFKDLACLGRQTTHQTPPLDPSTRPPVNITSVPCEAYGRGDMTARFDPMRLESKREVLPLAPHDVRPAPCVSDDRTSDPIQTSRADGRPDHLTGCLRVTPNKRKRVKCAAFAPFFHTGINSPKQAVRDRKKQQGWVRNLSLCTLGRFGNFAARAIH